MPISSCKICLLEFVCNPLHSASFHICSEHIFKQICCFTQHIYCLHNNRYVVQGPLHNYIESTSQPYFVFSYITQYQSSISEWPTSNFNLIRIRKNNQVSGPLLSLKLSIALLPCLMLSLSKLFIYTSFHSNIISMRREYLFTLFTGLQYMLKFFLKLITYFSSINNTEHEFSQN